MNTSLTEQEIQRLLKRRFDSANFHLFNAFLFAQDWETDYFHITGAGYYIEFEIKLTRSDYFADFKKPKHQILANAHIQLGNIPNKFYYVTPIGLIKDHELPAYAGLIEVDSWPDVKINAPFIHKRKLDMSRQLLHKFYFRYEKLSFENHLLKKEIEKLS